jgi:hypothetical protein
VRVHGVESDDLAEAGDVLEPSEHHRIALLGGHLLERRDDPADGHDLPVAAPLELVDRTVGLAAELVADRRQRVIGDVEAERLLLQLEQLVLRELAGRDDRVVTCRRIAPRVVAEVEDRALAKQLVGLLLLSPGERLFEAFEHPAPRRAGRIERAALDERLERPLVDGLRVDALGEVPDRRECPALLARPHDRAAR